MSVQKAILLNNQAVLCLESNLFNDAILLSCAALEMFQQHQHMAAQVSLQRGNDSDIDQFILDHKGNMSSDDTMNGFIYQNGIILPTDAALKDPSVITPVLIFNCALSHQLLASQCNDEGTSHKYLGRAKRLYQLASDQQEQDMNMIFKFAMVNNIGVIHRSLGNYEESKRCFGLLVSLMMVYVDAGVESKRLQLIRGFWKNVLEDNGSMAPAA